MSIKIQKPSVGRIVIYTDYCGDSKPAVILAVDHGKDTCVSGEVTLRDFVTLMLHEKIKHNADVRCRTWRYPPRVDGEISVDD